MKVSPQWVHIAARGRFAGSLAPAHRGSGPRDRPDSTWYDPRVISAFRGANPQIHELAYVHPAAVLIGDVRIGQESSVWPNATLRGDDGPIVVGEQTSIQDNVVIHCVRGRSHTTIGSRVTVGHSAVLHGCTIADDVLIGMGAIILDEARIEPGVIVAAGTVVSPGKTIPADSLVVGNPFRVLRRCREQDRELIAFSWREYVQRARDYRGEPAEEDPPTR
ncbi:MAG: gamma carbonic anhydrase family protein [Myxococcales bacterium FL481]|nr:MAG: gamma carbonic anhydrase family protein [Myxococcales bacterium FL481]